MTKEEMINRYAGTKVEARARELCLQSCRALMCEKSGQCGNSWPGDGSGAHFWPFIEQAAAELGEEKNIEHSLIRARTLEEHIIPAFESSLANRRAELADCLGQIRKELERGETTGDPVQDLVLLAGLGLGLVEPFRKLQEALKGKKGEFVLLSFTDDVPYKHVFGKGYELKRQRCYRIGVLESETLVFWKGMFFKGIVLPVSRYIGGFESPTFGGEFILPTPEEANIDLNSGARLGSRGNPPRLEEIVQIKEVPNPILMVGDEATKQWLKKRAMQGLFEAAAKALNKPLPEVAAA